MRISDDVLDDAVTPAGFRIGQPVIERALFRILDLMLQVAPFFVAEGLAIGDQKLKIAGVRAIHVGIIQLVDDAVAEGEPDAAAGVVSGADAFLGAAGPTRFDPGRAEGVRVVRVFHKLKFEPTTKLIYGPS